MKKMLITGGTVFVSRYAAEYFSGKYDVYVLNRNTHAQCENVTLIQCDRHSLENSLRGLWFDAILDITAYDRQDVDDLLDALDGFGDYILISSSAVYPETGSQPFQESATIGANSIWGAYGTDKIAAEHALMERFPKGYILRPPYLYGPWNNVYREAFVFDCARDGRPFYLPGDGSMQLQFFHVRDLCRMMEAILEEHPQQHIFNVGNPASVSIRQWVDICYEIAGKKAVYIPVHGAVAQRAYFPFHPYEYHLDVSGQEAVLSSLTGLKEGLQESYHWYTSHADAVRKKPLLEYIDNHLT